MPRDPGALVVAAPSRIAAAGERSGHRGCLPVGSGGGVFDEIVERNQSWPVMTAKHGVDGSVPPWKTSLDGLCDALDRSCGTAEQIDFTFKERRNEEDELSMGKYANLPHPDNQLVALAHSLMARGVIDEHELRHRLARIRARLDTWPGFPGSAQLQSKRTAAWWISRADSRASSRRTAR